MTVLRPSSLLCSAAWCISKIYSQDSRLPAASESRCTSQVVGRCQEKFFSTFPTFDGFAPVPVGIAFATGGSVCLQIYTRDAFAPTFLDKLRRSFFSEIRSGGLRDEIDKCK